MNLSDRSRTLIASSSSLPKALVAAIGVGVAFGAGLVVGGIGEAEAAPRVGAASSSSALIEPADPLARAEARTRAYEALMTGTRLSWHKELTSFDPALPPPPSPAKLAKATSTKPTPAPLSESPSSSPIVDKAVVNAPPEPAPVVKKADAAHDDDKDAADAADAADGDKGEVTAPDPRRLDDAMARVLGAPRKPDAAASTDKRYAVQLASTSTEAAARVMADGWAQRGQKADVVSADVAGKGTVYRVRIGNIASRAAAEALKLKLGQGLVVSD